MLPAAADWSQLPSDLLRDIAGRLSHLTDLSRFSSVCVSWRRSAQTPIAAQLPLQHPWILLDRYSETCDKCRFFSLTDSKTYTISLPESLSQRFFAPSHRGWIAVGSKDPPAVLSLLNPITRRSIPLPPLPYQQHQVVKKLKLLGSGLVAALCPISSAMFLIRVGEANWKGVVSTANDLAHHEGSIFLTSGVSGVTEILDTGSLRRVGVIPSPLALLFNQYRPYLVELPSRELLLVLRNMKLDRRRRFQVFRLDSIGQRPSWGSTRCIGEHVLFADSGNAMGFDAGNDFEGRCRRNCIYFGELDVRVTGFGGQRNVGVFMFDIETGRTERASSMHTDDLRRIWPWAMWVVPSLSGFP